MRIQFDYGWYNDDKTVIRYAARDNWNWKDYHAAVHASVFAVQTQPHTVHTLIDFSTGQREKFPAGVRAHAHTFGKKLAPNLSGKAVVIGAPPDVLQTLGVTETRRMTTSDGEVHFVDDEAAAQALLAEWG